MDISLNISTTPSIIKSQTKNISPGLRQTKGKNKLQENGFAFEFTKSDKVKAVVARRRPQTIIKPKVSFLKSKALIKKKQLLIKPRRNFVSAPSDSDSDDLAQPQKHEIETELSLNIVQGDVSAAKLQRMKLSKDERLKLKRKERAQKTRKVDRVLTQNEINEGMKKFTKLPVEKSKKPPIQKKEINVKRINLFENNPETKLIGQRFVKPIVEKIFTGNSLNTLDLHPHCVKNLADILQITELTTVQQKTIPHALAGKDILVRSQTGSGKTLAYALPIVEKLQEIRPKITREAGIFAVVIVPTRELAIQTYELLIKLLKPFQWVVPGFLTGGEKRKAEKARLRKGINILVGTPGRLVDHLLHTESFMLDKLKILVLDEADRLLDLGYERDVKLVVEAINDHRNGIFKRANENVTDQDKVQHISQPINENPFKKRGCENFKDDIEYSAQSIDGNPFKKRASENGKDTIEHISQPIDETAFKKPTEELQRLLLSATLTTAVQKLAGLTLKNPLFIDNSDQDPSNIIMNSGNYQDAVEDAVNEGKLVIPENLQLSYVLVPPKLRLVTLSGMLAKEKRQIKAMVFMATTEMVNFHHDLLNETLTQKILDDEDEMNESEDDDGEDPILLGLRFFKLHGSMTQQERSGIFRAFRDAKSGVLLTTDVAGRGIDVPEVDLVVQYSAPQKIADFVHRVGRTARAGRSGRAVLFLGPGETDFVRMLEDKRIRISQIIMEDYLNALNELDSEANSVQEAASNLQHKFEILILDDKEMKAKASKAFVSWLKNYSTFPKDLKPIFNVKLAHMGHYAKSFGLRDPPTNFAHQHTEPKPKLPTNRLTYTDRDQPKIDKKTAQKRSLGTKVGLDGVRGRNISTNLTSSSSSSNNNNNNFNNNTKLKNFTNKSMALSISEFGSGIPAKKKRII